MKIEIEWMDARRHKPEIGDEYLVHYDLQDGGEPVTSLMFYDSKEDKWTDMQGDPDLRQNEQILYWAELPDGPKANTP